MGRFESGDASGENAEFRARVVDGARRAPGPAKVLLGLIVSLGLVGADCDPISEEEHPTDTKVLGRGGRCDVQDDCFACDTCRSPHAEVCLEGLCWVSGELGADDIETPLLGSYNVVVLLPREFDAGKLRSAAIRVLHPLRTDGTRVTCEQLLVDPKGVDVDDTLNRLRVLNPPVTLNTRDDVANLGAGHIPVGEDRLFFVRMHELRSGEGDYLTVGCAEDVPVEDSREQKVTVETDE